MCWRAQGMTVDLMERKLKVIYSSSVVSISILQIADFFLQKIHINTALFFKGITSCFFTRTSLLKSSNNLEPICNDVNIKLFLLVLLRIISVTITFTVLETYTTHVNLKNLKVIIFQYSCIKRFTVHFSRSQYQLPWSSGLVV